MRRFITKTLCFSLPLLLIAIGMEILLRNIPNDYSLKGRYLNDHASEIETIVLGSSHAFYGINPDFFSGKTFNASYISQTLDYDFELLKKYDAKLANVRTVVLTMSYFTLFVGLEAGPESWRVKNYIIYHGLDSSNSLADHSEVLGNRIPVNARRLLSFYVLGNSPISSTPLGWGAGYNSTKAQDLFETGKASARRHTRVALHSHECQEMLRGNIAVLNSIIQWCKTHNARLLLITPPAFESYRHSLDPEQLDITLRTARALCSNHDHCRHVNLLADTNFVAPDYYDADHLSEIGAEKLSRFIDGIIRSGDVYRRQLSGEEAVASRKGPK